MHQFPALMIGGPPHSGKSVLAYSLTQALRARQIDHYLLRACPDGEGDWSNEADQGMVQILRPKGVFNAVFVAQIHQAIQGRLLPLLVDVGGQPRPDQEVILAACSHAILIAADAAGLATWRALAQRLNIPVIAELISSLTDPDARWSDTTTPLRGRIFGLVRGQHVAGPVVQRLVDVVATHLALPTAEIRRLYLAMAPVEMAVDLDRVALKLGLQINGRWLPSEILPVLRYLPTDAPLAIYGRGTVWLYAALALHSWPAPFHQFDPRLGWVQPWPITLTPDAQPGLLDWQIDTQADHCLLQLRIVDNYLAYHTDQPLALPVLPQTHGLILSGKLPYWLWTALVRAFTQSFAKFDNCLGFDRVRTRFAASPSIEANGQCRQPPDMGRGSPA